MWLNNCLVVWSWTVTGNKADSGESFRSFSISFSTKLRTQETSFWFMLSNKLLAQNWKEEPFWDGNIIMAVWEVRDEMQQNSPSNLPIYWGKNKKKNVLTKRRNNCWLFINTQDVFGASNFGINEFLLERRYTESCFNQLELGTVVFCTVIHLITEIFTLVSSKLKNNFTCNIIKNEMLIKEKLTLPETRFRAAVVPALHLKLNWLVILIQH